MINYTDQNSLRNRLFKTPYDNTLDQENRVVMLARFIPWDKMSRIFIECLSGNDGRGSVDLRIIMGSMFIQHSMNLTDRETIQLLQENIYMQYFIGLSSFQTEPVFHHSLLSIFRKRLGKEGSEKLNDTFIKHAFDSKALKHRKSRSTIDSAELATQNTTKQDKTSKPVQQNKGDSGTTAKDDVEGNGGNPEKNEVPNRGTVKIDATVVPQHITYPTDTKLLNHARELSEQIIDYLYEQSPRLWPVKPRTYRREARKKWLSFSKSRKPSKKKIRRQKRSDLNYIKRNLGHIDEMMKLIQRNGQPIVMKEVLRKKLYVISEIHRQQQIMYKDKRKRISDRIVSISQPWVRPIVRGKAGSPVEFGAKINISLTEKMITVDQSSFNAFNESIYLQDQIEAYKKRFGYYPEYALVDKIYLTRGNREYLGDKGIKHTGAPLGRPPNNKKKKNPKTRKKNNERNHVVGKIGQGKVKYGLDNLRTKTMGTSYAAINLIALAMNMLALQKGALWLMCTYMKWMIDVCITSKVKHQVMTYQNTIIIRI